MILNTMKIELLLGEQKMTKKRLSEVSGISAPNVSTILKRGTCNPVTAVKISAALGVDVFDILEEEK